MLQRKIALITGASAGLGKEFAALFARDGHNVILVARSARPLAQLAEVLQRDHGISAITLTVDLSEPQACERVHREIGERGMQVDFLVNNAGLGSCGPFLDQDLEREVAMVEVNITALMRLCHLFAPDMCERGVGRILNIGSTAGFQPGPYMATYYASKAFVISFSQALAYEVRDRGVTVTCHCPGATATEFAQRAGNAGTRLFQRPGVATAAEVAAHAYRAMMRGDILSVHGAANKLGAFFTRLVPRQATTSIAARLNQAAREVHRVARP